MAGLKDQIVRAVGHNANKKVAELTTEFVNASPEEKEAILAGIDFERWLGETCAQCIEKSKKY